MRGATVPHHREFDHDGSDYRQSRILRPLNGHTKWVVGVGTAAILGLAGLGFARISGDATEALRLSTSNNISIFVLQKQAEQDEAFRQEMKASLQRLEGQNREQLVALTALRSELRNRRQGRDE
jgi:hypothetical protein